MHLVLSNERESAFLCAKQYHTIQILEVKFMNMERYTRALPLLYSEIKSDRVSGHDPREFVGEIPRKLEGHDSPQAARYDRNDSNFLFR